MRRRLRDLERACKGALIAAIAALLPRSRRGERPDWRARTYRVLFLRHDRIGDMILSTGVLRAIAESHRTIELDVLSSPLNAPVIRHEPYVHDIFTFDRRAVATWPAALRELRARRYDAVIDCMVAAPSLTTLFLMMASKAPYRIGVAGRGNDFAYTLAVPPRETAEHLVDQLGTLVTAFGLQPSALDLRPRVRLTAQELSRAESVWSGDSAHLPGGAVRLVINVSAGRAHHQWPDDHFIAVARHARDWPVRTDMVVLSSAGERGRAARIAAESGARLVEDQGIRDAMAIVARSHCVFTPDTAIGHACSAFGIPAVVLHPKGNARKWGPYETDARVVESASERVSDIPVEQASAALQRLLERLARQVSSS